MIRMNLAHAKNLPILHFMQGGGMSWKTTELGDRQFGFLSMVCGIGTVELKELGFIFLLISDCSKNSSVSDADWIYWID